MAVFTSAISIRHAEMTDGQTDENSPQIWPGLCATRAVHHATTTTTNAKYYGSIRG